ncbi:hypothetical protein niasHT_014326 [Heterodera trifolii]|uniref:Uncharacterized protein n=1 Tax=Heterodera trifolii TaxID=157864 RepID=A0ABD2L7T0_9BILA
MELIEFVNELKTIADQEKEWADDHASDPHKKQADQAEKEADHASDPHKKQADQAEKRADHASDPHKKQADQAEKRADHASDPHKKQADQAEKRADHASDPHKKQAHQAEKRADQANNASATDQHKKTKLETFLGIMYLLKQKWDCGKISEKLKNDEELKECETYGKNADIIYEYFFQVYAKNGKIFEQN